MSSGEDQRFPESSKMPYGITTPQQNNGTRSFMLLVDDNGNIEVSPNSQVRDNSQVIDNQKMQNKSRKVSRREKQRIRIALIEDDGSGSDKEPDETNEVDQFVKIYDKKVHCKPSFVVLEDVLMRKRMAENLQGRSICHSHAEQQTSPCDIGAHTGCQTDEFLLHCALRSNMLKGQCRECQAKDMKLPENIASYDAKNSLLASSMRQLSQMADKLSQQHKINQQKKQPVASAVKVAPEATPAVSDPRAPHVTISFLTPNTQQQPMLVTTAATDQNSYLNYCTTMPLASSCNNCYLHVPTASNSQYSQLATFGQPQNQPLQQQHLGLTASCCNCCSSSSCCLQRPAFGCCHMPGTASPCNHSLVQSTQEYPTTSCATPGMRKCFCYPMHACNISALPASQCQHCATFHNDQQQLHQQKQQLSQLQEQHVCPGNMDINPLQSSPITPAYQLVNNQSQPDHSKDPQSSISKATLERMIVPTNNQKIAKKMRNKILGPSFPTTKLYRARFGRSCLILKPTSPQQYKKQFKE